MELEFIAIDSKKVDKHYPDKDYGLCYLTIAEENLDKIIELGSSSSDLLESFMNNLVQFNGNSDVKTPEMNKKTYFLTDRTREYADLFANQYEYINAREEKNIKFGNSCSLKNVFKSLHSFISDSIENGMVPLVFYSDARKKRY